MIAPALALAALLAARPAPAPAPAAPAKPVWLAEELPLPLAVRTPEDLKFKALAERQYLIFNLLASGKVAWDAGDWAIAASKWDALLRVPELPADVRDAATGFAAEAHKRAGGAAPAPVAMAAHAEPASAPAEEKAEPGATAVTVRGTVTGGGAPGPGGAVIWLERKDGPTPRPKPAKGKVIVQRNKQFTPRVLAVPVGTTVSFRNDDEIFHDVFSLSKPNEFDLGLYKGGTAKEQRFDALGPVQLLCNIHASMQGWVYVLKTPWYAQADGSGAFSIHGVPPGDYVLHAWHESAAKATEQALHVGEQGAAVAVAVGGDAARQAFVPDKYGKPRQVQLGY